MDCNGFYDNYLNVQVTYSIFSSRIQMISPQTLRTAAIIADYFMSASVKWRPFRFRKLDGQTVKTLKFRLGTGFIGLSILELC